MARKKIPVYSEPEELEGLRAAGRFNAQLMDEVRKHIAPGITTGSVDDLVLQYTTDHGHVPATLGYKEYPNSTCTSVNEVVCHGIPGSQELKPGDIVNVDLTSIVDGWYGDQSETFMIGGAAALTDEARRLVQTTFESMWAGIRAIRPFGRVIDIGNAVYRFAKGRGFEVVRQYQGHGLGRAFHQEPGIPHFPDAGSRKDIIQPGVCFTVEPMLNVGTWKTKKDGDGWTVRTKDGKLSAQFEHTVLMTDSGPEILTLTNSGPQEGDQLQ